MAADASSSSRFACCRPPARSSSASSLARARIEPIRAPTSTEAFELARTGLEVGDAMDGLVEVALELDVLVLHPGELDGAVGGDAASGHQ